MLFLLFRLFFFTVHRMFRDQSFNENTRFHHAIPSSEVSIHFTTHIVTETALKLIGHCSICRECINRVCEAASLKSSKKRRVDKRVLQCIADTPNMQNSGTNVTLTVSSKYLSLVSVDTAIHCLVAQHDMPRISFASGGDTVSLDRTGSFGITDFLA